MLGPRAGRVLLAMVLVTATCVIPTGRVVARTSVTVDGATVTLTVPVDLIGATSIGGIEISGKGDDGGVITISKYWATAAKVWNDAFAKLSYKGCVNFKLDLQFFPKSVYDLETPGHHAIFINRDPDARSMVYDVKPDAINGVEPDATFDTTGAFTADLGGDWKITTVPTISHEVGHLLGLGDDYTDVKDADGKVISGKPKAGREDTMMAGGSKIDQNLVDRIGKLLDKAGKQLPQCWTGTMKSSADETVTAGDIGLVCSGTWTTALSLAIAPDGIITGTAVGTVDGPPKCQGTPYTTQMQMFRAPITGTATDTELRFRLGTPSSYEPAGSGDFTGLTATIYSADPSGSTFTIPITSPGHAQGAQQLQFGSDASGKFTSENAIVLDCQTC